MPTSERTPDSISLSRISMGWVKRMFTPGRVETVSCIATTSSSWVFAFVHCSRGVRDRKMSVSSVPMGSVAISAVPIRLQTWRISSGNFSFRSCSMRVLYSVEVSMDVPARRMVLAVMAPSLSLGMNSPPRREARMPVTTSNATTKARTGQRSFRTRPRMAE